MSEGPAVAGPTLRTPRLVLQPITPADREALHALLTHPEVRRYLMDDAIVPIEDVDGIVATSVGHFGAGLPGHFALRLREDGPEGRLVGTSGLARFADGTTPELLYALQPGFQGRGLAVEATRAVLAHVFAASELPLVYARADVPNVASVRVMELLGMRFLREEEENGLPLVTYVMTREMLLSGRGEAPGRADDSPPGPNAPRSR